MVRNRIESLFEIKKDATDRNMRFKERKNGVSRKEQSRGS